MRFLALISDFPTIKDEVKLVGCQGLVKLTITCLNLSWSDPHFISNSLHNLDFKTDKVGRVLGIFKYVGSAIDIVRTPL